MTINIIARRMPDEIIYSICQYDAECLKRIRDGVSEIDAVIALRWKFPNMGYSEAMDFIKSI